MLKYNYVEYFQHFATPCLFKIKIRPHSGSCPVIALAKYNSFMPGPRQKNVTRINNKKHLFVNFSKLSEL